LVRRHSLRDLPAPSPSEAIIYVTKSIFIGKKEQQKLVNNELVPLKHLAVERIRKLLRGNCLENFPGNFLHENSKAFHH